MTNLINNSSKYSGLGSRIALNISVEGNLLSITIKDSGIGMSKETQTNLFTPFFRSKDEFTQSEPGTGLGLVIVKNITDLHGGTISVTSELEVGTTVHVTLPGCRERPSVDDLAAEQTA
jgi:signal transduction histidine kinase